MGSSYEKDTQHGSGSNGSTNSLEYVSQNTARHYVYYLLDSYGGDGGDGESRGFWDGREAPYLP